MVGVMFLAVKGLAGQSLPSTDQGVTTEANIRKYAETRPGHEVRKTIFSSLSKEYGAGHPFWAETLTSLINTNPNPNPKLVEMLLALKPPIQNGVVSSYDYSSLASTASRHSAPESTGRLPSLSNGSPQSWDASNTPMRINPEGQNSMQHMAGWKISAQPCYLAEKRISALYWHKPQAGECLGS
jgi:hypothetical protein